MTAVIIPYLLSVSSILILIYALLRQDWLAAFVTLILWILIGVWLLLSLKGVPREERGNGSGSVGKTP